ncbi:MAG: sulfopyruvate decarboxylase subunit alpha [Candidatus Bathyarchaeum sp.]|nr:MAG: sulfopyruvate decarboxylase subunit alpha [Candidatus Bathyarchaeum sp.]
MKAADFCSALKERGFNIFAGVPCSILKDTILYLQRDPDVSYVSATREDEAIGIAAGSFLGGQKPVVLMQNSGLGNSIGALASLPLLYKIPMLLVVSWRGYQGKDAPEHSVMGKSILKLLRDFGIPTKILPKRNPEKTITEAVKVMDEQQIPVAIIIKRGVIS